MDPTAEKPRPRYQQIKDDLLTRIAAGEWKVGDAIPPEETLAREFAVARMTVNRALRELTEAGHLRRARGSGTFVAPFQVEASLLAIRNIADEIAGRGHRHRSQVQVLERATADAALATAFDRTRGARLFHSVIVHFENEVPIQVEDRWVSPELAPDYLGQDFGALTPNAYLSAVAPLSGARYSVEARLPPPAVAEMLAIGAGFPCLVVNRTTLVGERVASVATLWHPGERYRLTGSL
jgi:GntR family histidine utilization transcriptional repressor